jgi:hypothetical protein
VTVSPVIRAPRKKRRRFKTTAIFENHILGSGAIPAQFLRPAQPVLKTGRAHAYRPYTRTYAGFLPLFARCDKLVIRATPISRKGCWDLAEGLAGSHRTCRPFRWMSP